MTYLGKLQGSSKEENIKPGPARIDLFFPSPLEETLLTQIYLNPETGNQPCWRLLAVKELVLAIISNNHLVEDAIDEHLLLDSPVNFMDLPYSIFAGLQYNNI